MKRITIEKIYNIFLKRTGIDFQKNRELVDQKLFGRTINIPPRELLQIYMDLEKEMDNTFCERDLIQKKFDTFTNIVKLIEETCGYSVYE